MTIDIAFVSNQNTDNTNQYQTKRGVKQVDTISPNRSEYKWRETEPSETYRRHIIADPIYHAN